MPRRERVACSIEPADLENEDGRTQEGVRATCTRCDHTTESFGTSERSKRRCLALMGDECPRNEDNYYFDEDDA